MTRCGAITKSGSTGWKPDSRVGSRARDTDLTGGGIVGKLTIAPQLSLGNAFLSRPVLRAFLIYATWSDGLQGEIGGPDHAGRNDGWTRGVQMESYW